MIKHTLAAIVLFLIGTAPMSAQEATTHSVKKEQRENTSLQRPFILSLTIGPNFNTGGSDYSEWFGTRADVVTQFNCRMNVAFARHWCAYLDAGFSFFKIQTDDVITNIAQGFADKLMPGLSRIKPSFDIGVSYLAETRKWQFMPRAGIGWMSAGNSNRSKTINEKECKLKMNRNPLYVNAGASVGYRTSRVCSVILDVNYRCPIRDCKATYTTTEPDSPSVTQTMKSHSWANDLSVSLGIQLQCEIAKK